MSRRAPKHLAQQEFEPPSEGQQIVRALGSRGSNLIEVEYPGGRTTLCLLPAKFHKKLWIKKGSFLYVEGVEDADARVTGQIVRVLYDDDVKQLKRMGGLWPAEFEQQQQQQEAPGGGGDVSQQLEGLELGKGAESGAEGSGSDSDDSLPPIQRINNRRVIEYEVSESESEEE